MMESEKRISFSLVSIKEEKFEAVSDLNTTWNGLSVQCLLETEIHPKEEIVYVRSGVRYLVEKSVVCECVLGLSFLIEDFHTVVTIDEECKRINFSSNLMPTFLSITYGALRGALYERVKGTPLELYPLPLLSMPELEKNNHFKVIR